MNLSLKYNLDAYFGSSTEEGGYRVVIRCEVLHHSRVLYWFSSRWGRLLKCLSDCLHSTWPEWLKTFPDLRCDIPHSSVCKAIGLQGLTFHPHLQHNHRLPTASELLTAQTYWSPSLKWNFSFTKKEKVKNKIDLFALKLKDDLLYDFDLTHF